MPLTPKAVNQLEMAKTPIAAEIESSLPELRSWIAVYPPRIDRGLKSFVVRRFDVRRELVDNDSDIHAEDLINGEKKAVANIQEVEAILEEWKMPAERLSAPWHCDYPL